MYMNKGQKCTAKNIFHMLWYHLAKFGSCTCILKLRIPSWHAPPDQTFSGHFLSVCMWTALFYFQLNETFDMDSSRFKGPLSYCKTRLSSWSTVSDILLHHLTIFIIHLSYRTCTTVSDHGPSSFHSFTTVTLHVLGYKCYRITGWWTHFSTTVCSLHIVLTHTGVFHHLRASDTHTMSSWAEAKWQTTGAVLFCQSLPDDGKRVHHSFSSSTLQYIIHQLQYIIPSAGAVLFCQSLPDDGRRVHHSFSSSVLQYIIHQLQYIIPSVHQLQYIIQFISSSVHHSFSSPAWVYNSFSPSVHQLFSTSFLQFTSFST